MMTLIVMLWALVGVMVIWPATAAARTLHGMLVEPLARRLNRITRGQASAALIVGSALVLVFLLFGAEGLRPMAMAAPELMTWLALFDVATLAEGMAGAAVLAATQRWATLKVTIRGAVSSLTAPFRRRATRARSGRPPARRPRRPGRRDDPDPFGWAQAVAG